MLRVDSRARKVMVHSSPLGGGHEEPFEAPFRATELPAVRRLWNTVVAGRGITLGAADPTTVDHPVATPQALGARLFDSVFHGATLHCLLESLARTDRRDDGLSLRLVFGRHDAALASLPWELLYWPARHELLARSIRTPVARTLIVPRPIELEAIEPPLRVLLVAASPNELPRLQVEREVASLRQRLAALAVPVVVEQLERPASADRLRRALRQATWHIVHFAGHGAFDAATGLGRLAFEASRDRAQWIDGPELAATLQGLPPLHLIVLAACRSGEMPDETRADAFLGAAQALVAGGQPRVLAMQHAIEDEAAIRFNEMLYDRLVSGDAVDVAVTEARGALARATANDWQWAVPVLFLRGEGRIATRPGAAPTPARRPRIDQQILDSSTLIAEKTRGFVGRRFLFEQLDAFITDRATEPGGALFEVRGDPGIGKTSFLAELVRRRRCVHHFVHANPRPIERFLLDVCAQLVSSRALPFDLLPARAGRNSAFLVELLARSIDAGAAPLLLVADALDEAAGSGTTGNVLDLPVLVPAGVVLVVSYRDPGSIRLRFDGAVGGFAFDSGDPRHLRDVETFVEAHLHHPGIESYRRTAGLSASSFVDRLCDASEGNFMYLRHVLSEITHGSWNEGTLPRGLEQYYAAHWRRLRDCPDGTWFDFRLPVLAALTTLESPVSVELLALLLEHEDSLRIAATVAELRSFLAVDKVDDGSGRPTYRLYHQSFRDFLAARAEIIEASRPLRRRLDSLQANPP